MRVKALAQIEVDVDVDEQGYAAVAQAVQDAIGHTGAVVIDVEEYEEIPAT